MNYNPTELYQPILFKRTKKLNWEPGWKKINDNGETFLEEDRKTTVKQVSEYRVDWGINIGGMDI